MAGCDLVFDWLTNPIFFHEAENRSIFLLKPKLEFALVCAPLLISIFVIIAKNYFNPLTVAKVRPVSFGILIVFFASFTWIELSLRQDEVIRQKTSGIANQTGMSLNQILAVYTKTARRIVEAAPPSLNEGSALLAWQKSAANRLSEMPEVRSVELFNQEKKSYWLEKIK